ncbi:unnamed protein product [Dracunculus medinensis]|uniref:Vacuolar protein sorting-associated protein 52 homolog n=1 Tax=Dracunculus medinensis TaxID=318479 RepID=A0A0N4UC11_DRAME|nr:unnamed protein product [Dracunculus medinensis]
MDVKDEDSLELVSFECLCAPGSREKGINENIIETALECGADLRQYSIVLKEKLDKAHQFAVQDCIEQADKLALLYTEISACDDAFANLEEMLTCFQSELGTVSSDMKRLQQQSIDISLQLQNNQKVRGELSQFVDDMVVPVNMINTILNSDVGERDFLEQLHELQHKLQFLKAQEFKDAKAVVDVQDVIENLKYKAMAKIREWILLKISSFKKPLTNYQIPQGALLKNRYTIRDEYIDTTSKMLFTYFKSYASRLFKLQLADAASKDDLLGAEDTIKTGRFFTAKPMLRNRATVFSLGTRDSLLSMDLMAPLIVPHVAMQSNQKFNNEIFESEFLFRFGFKFQFENLYRSLQFALVDHSSHEFIFLCDYFLVSGRTAVEFFNQIMMRSITVLLKICEEHTATNYDAISLYLCLCLCSKYKELMVEREIPTIAEYWDTLTRILWQRFEVVMQLHDESVRAVDIKKLQPPPDIRPHYIIRRYAEFTCALLICCHISKKHIENKLQRYLSKQQSIIEDFLNRLASQMNTAVDRIVCLINNYDLILSILEERINFESKEKLSFWELQQNCIIEYVVLMLKPHFGDLINFVVECEPLIEQGHTQLLLRHSSKVTGIVRSFSANWKRSIDAINQEIIRSFTNFKNGTNILQATFTELIQYYHRFSKVTAHEAFADNSVLKELVNIHHIMVELKKYKPVY